MEISAVGLDIAKRVFQLHGVDAAGKAVLRLKLQRSEVLAFFKALPLVWSALRLAARRIIGRVKSGNWGMRCD
jgi:transposase